MEQVDLIPFSNLIAGILSIKESCTSIEIVNMISELSYMGIIVEDEYDDFESISCCVEMDENYNFYLKKGLDYDSVLSSGDLVLDFLKFNAGETVLLFLNRNIDKFISSEASVEYTENYYSGMIENVLILIRNLMGRNKKTTKEGRAKVKRRNLYDGRSFIGCANSTFRQVS